VYLVKNYDNLKFKKYFGVIFYNFYLSKNGLKSFIIVEKYEIKSKWNKTEVYFFNKEGGSWKFHGKKLLLVS